MVMSVQTGPPAKPIRVQMNFRVHPSKREWLREVAKEHNVDVAVVIRAALAIASRHPSEFVERIKDSA